MWCNGSTSDSGSACGGSNPSKATIATLPGCDFFVPARKGPAHVPGAQPTRSKRRIVKKGPADVSAAAANPTKTNPTCRGAIFLRPRRPPRRKATDAQPRTSWAQKYCAPTESSHSRPLCEICAKKPLNHKKLRGLRCTRTRDRTGMDCSNGV